MADNLGYTEGAGKTIRSIEKNAGTTHSQVLQIDIGAGTTELLLTAGQKTMANSVPVVIASDQSALSFSLSAAIPAGDNNIGNVDIVTMPAITGTVSVSGTVAISAASLPLPTGAATETTLGTRLAESTFTTRINTQGQKAMAASTPVVLASDHSSVAVNLSAALPAGTNNIGDVDIISMPAITGTVSISGTVPISAVSLPLPTGAATETTLGTRLADATFTGRINTLGQKTMANSTPVVLASDQSGLSVSVSNLTFIENSIDELESYVDGINSSIPGAVVVADGISPSGTAYFIGFNYLFDGTNWDRQRSIVAGLDSTGSAIPCAGIVGQFDDTATAAVTENQFAPVRISSRRALLVEGVASGTNINVNVNAALPAGSNNIGDVDIVSMPAITGTVSISGSVAVTNAGTFATQDSQVLTDNGGFSDGSSKLFQAGFVFDEVAGTALTENDAAAARIDSKRAQVLVIEDATTRGTRAVVSAPSSDNISSALFTGLVTVNCGYYYDGSNWDRIRGTQAGGLWVQGNVAHDAADTDNPVKIGGKGYNLQPASSGTEPGPTSVAANDRTDLMTGLKGEITEHPLGVYYTLSNVSTDYDTAAETATSQNIDCFKYRKATIGFTLSSTGTPTDIQFIVEVSLDGTNYFELKNGALGQWIYDDTFVATAKNIAYTFDIACRNIRLKVVSAGGSSGSVKFTVSNAAMFLSN